MTTHRQHPGPKSYEEQLCAKLAHAAKEHGLNEAQAEAMIQVAAEGLQWINEERQRRKVRAYVANHRRRKSG